MLALQIYPLTGSVPVAGDAEKNQMVQYSVSPWGAYISVREIIKEDHHEMQRGDFYEEKYGRMRS